MKKLLKITTLFLTLLVILPSMAFSQKYGHLNSGNLLASMPNVSAADKELSTYQKNLGEAFKAKVDTFQARYQEVVELVNSGALNQIQIQEKEQTLKKEQEQLAKEEKENIGKVQKKRQELLQPVLDKVDQAIRDVATENGYSMIFETSMINTVLFAKDTEDVMPLVKKKLGL